MATTPSGATWGVDRIDQRNLPLSGSYVYNADGSGVSAYVENGVPVSGLSDSVKCGQKSFTFNVPAGSTSLSFQLSGGTGDADIYVRYGAAPTTTQYDYRPYLVGNNETVNVSDPQAGTWYVMVRAYAVYSGASLKATAQ